MSSPRYLQIHLNIMNGLKRNPARLVTVAELFWIFGVKLSKQAILNKVQNQIRDQCSLENNHLHTCPLVHKEGFPQRYCQPFRYFFLANWDQLGPKFNQTLLLTGTQVVAPSPRALSSQKSDTNINFFFFGKGVKLVFDSAQHDKFVCIHSGLWMSVLFCRLYFT